MEVAIVGAGMAGAACARGLADAGLAVTVFEKSRGAGGRMSTRRVPPHAFDHGAQYATARSPAFRAAMQDWVAAGVAAPWDAQLVDLRAGEAREHASEHPRYVGVPGMNAICKHLLADVPLQRATRVAHIERRDTGWALGAEDGAALGSFDAVVVTAPPAQARLLLHDAQALADEVEQARLAPCWTWMAAFEGPTGLAFDGAFVHESPLAWIARNSTKPGRAAGETWVAQASAAWTRAHLEDEPAVVARQLEAAFATATGHERPPPATALVHRWMYANPERGLERPCLWDADLRIGVAGDWLCGARVEAAWTSGVALAQAIRQVS